MASQANITVTTTASRIDAQATQGAYAHQVNITNTGAVAVSYGGVGITGTTGDFIPAGGVVRGITLERNEQLYAVAASTTAVLRITYVGTPN